MARRSAVLLESFTPNLTGVLGVDVMYQSHNQKLFLW